MGVDIDSGSTFIKDVGVAGSTLFAVGNSGLILRYTADGRAERLTSPNPGNIVNVTGTTAGRVFILIFTVGVYYSDDLGDTWTLAISDAATRQMATNDAGIVLVTTSAVTGYYSTDNGTTFNTTSFGDQGMTTNNQGGLKYYSEIDTFVKIYSNSWIFTTSNGTSWSNIEVGTTDAGGFVAQQYHDGTLYLGDTNSLIYKTTDFGLTISSDRGNLFYNDEIGIGTTSFQCTALAAFNNRLYTARGAASFEVLDTAAGETSYLPPCVGSINSMTSGATGYTEFDGDIWVASSTSLLRTLKHSTIEDLQSDVFIGTHMESGVTFNDIAVVGDYVFIVGASGTILRFSPDGSVDDIAGPSSQNIYRVLGGVSNRVFICMNNLGVYYSDDLGDSWTLALSGTDLHHIASTSAGVIVVSRNTTNTGYVSVNNGETWSSEAAQGTGNPTASEAQVLTYRSGPSRFIKLCGQVINTSADGVTWVTTDHTSGGYEDFYSCEYFSNTLYIGDEHSRIYTSTDIGVTLVENTNTFYNEDSGSSSTSFSIKSMKTFNDTLYVGHNTPVLSYLDGSAFKPVTSATAEKNTSTTDGFENLIEYKGSLWGINDEYLYRTLIGNA